MGSTDDTPRQPPSPVANGEAERSQYQAVDRAVFAALGEGDGVIVDTQTAFYFGLNRTAAFLWKLLQRPAGATLGELTDALCERFTVERQAAERDAREFLDKALQGGLLARRAPISPAGTS